MILALDTSQSSASLALEDDRKLLYSIYFDPDSTHSETLMPAIDAALKFLNKSRKDISQILLAIGPGSFTGLRIGLATAKGIAFGLQIPLAPFSSLQMLAYNAFGCGKPVVAAIDARMQEVYLGVYDHNMQILSAPKVGKAQDFIETIPKDCILVGSAAEMISELLKGIDHPHTVAHLHKNKPCATSLLGLSRLFPATEAYDFEALASLEPEYLRDSAAQIKHRQKHGEK